jgi:hypothetical protein
MSCQKGVLLMLLYTEIQTVTFGRMNLIMRICQTKRAYEFSLLSISDFADTPFWHDALDIQPTSDTSRKK